MKLTIALFYLIAVTAAVTDWREYRIPDGCCMAVVFTAVLDWLTGGGVALPERIAGSIVVSAPMFLLALCVRGSFGGGDIKFMAACGFFLGWKEILASAMYAIGAAGAFAVFLLYRGYGREDRFPLGPFLVFGMIAELNGWFPCSMLL